MLTIALDASTYRGSVAIVRDGAILAEAQTAMRGEREERLMPAVAEVLSRAGVALSELEAVACGAGPGSFTSLRIAASIAKGLAAAGRLPLYASSSLVLMAAARPTLPARAYRAMLDAMRGDVFGLDLRVSDDGIVKAEGEFWIAPAGDALREARESGREALGFGTEEAEAPHARGFASLLAHGTCERVDLASWEPSYGRKAEAQVRWELAHGRPLEGR